MAAVECKRIHLEQIKPFPECLIKAARNHPDSNMILTILNHFSYSNLTFVFMTNKRGAHGQYYQEDELIIKFLNYCQCFELTEWDCGYFIDITRSKVKCICRRSLFTLYDSESDTDISSESDQEDAFAD